jgi:transcriptional regulator with PAS, ATPase and Fis domain
LINKRLGHGQSSIIIDHCSNGRFEEFEDVSTIVEKLLRYTWGGNVQSVITTVVVLTIAISIKLTIKVDSRITKVRTKNWLKPVKKEQSNWFCDKNIPHILTNCKGSQQLDTSLEMPLSN